MRQTPVHQCRMGLGPRGAPNLEVEEFSVDHIKGADIDLILQYINPKCILKDTGRPLAL